jgi:hypothetical protein
MQRNAMQCILYKIYFWKVFHMYCKLICILYVLLCGQNFILVKCGCYIKMGDPDVPTISYLIRTQKFDQAL